MGKGKRLREQRQQARAESAELALPRNLAEGLRRGIGILEELSERGLSLEELAEERRAEAVKLASGLDLANALGQVVLANLPRGGDDYQESEEEAASYVLECAAAVLLDGTSGKGPNSSSAARILSFARDMRSLVQDAATIEGFRRAPRLAGETSPEASIHGRASMAHLMLRNPGWQWQEAQLLRELFGESREAEKLRASLGFDIEDALVITEAANQLLVQKHAGHIEQARSLSQKFVVGNPAHDWARGNLPAEMLSAPPQYIVGLWMLAHLGQALLFERAELAQAAEVHENVVEAFLREFTVTPGDGSSNGWFAAAEAVRWKPFVECRPGRFMLTSPSNALWALREAAWEQLKAGKAFERHRARWLETRATDHLARALSADEVHRGVTLTLEEGGSARTYEIDGLLRCGDVAIVVEAKSAMRNRGRRRGGAALTKHLRENITKAAEQTTRARHALAAGTPLTAQDGSPLVFGSKIREAHAVVVTLDDFSAAAPVLGDIAGSDLLPDERTIPWVVTLFELELACGTVEWPAQLIHFLQRRSRLYRTPQVRASDELDLWMHYLAKGLYFDKDEPPTSIASHTDPLDAWVLYEQGFRSTPVEKPRMTLDDATRRALDRFEQERATIGVGPSCALLDLSDETRAQIWRTMRRLRSKAAKRQRVQRAWMGIGEGEERWIFCGIATPDHQRDGSRSSLRRLMRERLSDHGLQRAVGLATHVSSPNDFDMLVAVDQSWRGPKPN